MYDTKGNKHHLCIRDGFFNWQQPHHLMHLKKKSQVLQCTNSKMLFAKRNFYTYWKFKDKFFKTKHESTVVLLSCGSIFY